MSLDQITNNLEDMSITQKRIAPILETPIIQEIFSDNADIYSADREIRHYILEVPNCYCGRHYDDEDFIYSKLTLPESPDLVSACGIDYLAYMIEHNLIINREEIDLNPNSVMAKILYIYQHISTYYTSLRHLRCMDRIRNMPSDLAIWIANATDTVRILLDKDLFHYQTTQELPLDKFREMIYGLELITCHIRLICNHYRCNGGGNFTLTDMNEGHLKKLLRLANNMCVVMIYFKIYL